MRCSPIIVFALAFFAAGVTHADDVKTAEDKLAKAREEYSKAMADIRKDIATQLKEKDAAESKLGAKASTDKLKAIAAEQKALEEDGVLPKELNFNTKKRITDAGKPLLAALGDAKAAYVNAKDLDKAAAIDKEIEEVKKGAGAVASLSELLTKDSVWEGRKKNDKNQVNPNGTDEPFELTVSERDGKKFKGTILVNAKRTYVVEGKVDGDKLTFTSEKKDNFQQTFSGQLKAGTVDFTFAGSGANGEAVKGTATLTPRKAK
jgi:hypothetical protein